MTKLRAAVILGLLSLPFLPYVAVYLQTLLFLPSLRPALDRAIAEEWGPDRRPRIIRVLQVVPQPVIYAVVPCSQQGETDEAGLLYRFQRTQAGWVWDGGSDAAWSDCGSADGNTFPPYPEVSEF